jgi:hypothetical protein
MDYRTLSDADLLSALRDLASRERTAKADFMACLGEAEGRENAVLSAGYSSLYDFCVRDLKLAESTAYQRVKVARLCRQRPEVLREMKAGGLNVSNLCLIIGHIETHPGLIDQIKGKKKREVEAILSSVAVARRIPDRIRVIPTPAPNSQDDPDLFRAASAPAKGSAQATASEKAPNTPADPVRPPIRAEFRFAANQEFLTAVERLKAILWHKHPAGALEDVLMTAVSEYLRRHDPLRRPQLSGAVPPSDPSSRKVGAAMRKAVWERDGARCTFAGPGGRCVETRGLEIDHVEPWALGGATELHNLRLLCRAHNEAERRRIFGDDCTRVQSR